MENSYLLKKPRMHEYYLLKHKIIISLIRKPIGFSKIRAIIFNILLAKRIYSCIRGKKIHKQKYEFAL
jgi:hypothetical protein